MSISQVLLISTIIQIGLGQANFVAVGSDTNLARNLAYSIDGISWNLATQNIFSNIANGVGYSTTQNKWIAVGDGVVNTMAWSPDGITWTGLGTAVFPAAGNDIAYSSQQNRWVAVGNIPNTIHHSTDGFTWTAVTPTIFSTMGNGVVYSSTLNQWVAVGRGTHTIATSPDGITWTGLGNIIFSVQGMSVNYANGVFVTTGQGTTTQAWSTNGLIWNATAEFISNMRHQAIYAENRWLMVGPASTNIQNSIDGRSWSNAINPAGQVDIYGITYNQGYDRYVAVGSGTNKIIYSSDGISWNAVTGSSSIFNTNAWKVATTNRADQIINPTPITADVINLIANTSIINNNISISINGNLTIVGDLALEGTWILTQTSTVNITGLLIIKGNTTYNSLQPIDCQTLSISSATGDSKLTIILSTNLSIGTSITYPVATYKTRSGSFNDVIVQSASTDCPVASQSYSSTTLTVTVTMTGCNPSLVEVASQNLPLGMIVGIAVGCAVLAAAVILVVILSMRRHRDRQDAVANVHIRDNSINDLKASTLKPNPTFRS